MINRFYRRQEGQGLVEYALILVLVAIVVIAVLMLLGPTIADVFAQITGSLMGVGGGGGGGGASAHVTSLEFNLNGSCSPTQCTVSSSQARVSIADQDGNPLDSALVSVRFQFVDGSGSGSAYGASGYTGGGWTSWLSPSPSLGSEPRDGGANDGVKVCVTNISATGYSYDSASNSITCTSSGY